MLLAPVAGIAIGTAHMSAFADRPGLSTDEATQSAQPTWTLTALADRFEARHINNVDQGQVPYDAVILRRTLSGVWLDCGAFYQPSITDNPVSRTWTYVIARPQSGACASVTGARFVAVGRKGTAESLTPAVP